MFEFANWDSDETCCFWKLQNMAVSGSAFSAALNYECDLPEVCSRNVCAKWAMLQRGTF